MKNLRLGQVLTTLVFAASAALPAAAASPEEVLRDWTKAWRTSKVAAMAAFYEDSKDVVAWESSGKVRDGAAGIRQMYEDAFNEVVFDAASMEELKIRQEGNTAWAHGRFRADTTVRADKSRWRLHVRSSFVLKRDGDTWKIVFEHFSPLADIPRVQRR
jgi:ketosteroid isomerase-like protein